MELLLLFLGLALGFSFLCSILEAVLLTVTPSHVASLEKEGARTGRRLRHLKENVDQPLAAILSLNTIAHTVGAAGVGAQAQVVFGSVYVAVVSGVMTFLVLVFSEIIPKTLGAVYWRQLAPATARILPVLIWGLYPLVWLSGFMTRMLAREGRRPGVSRMEIVALAEAAAETGLFEKGESHILRNLFRFSTLRVKDIMTPHTVVFALPEETTVGEVVDEHAELRFSRIPVYQETRDNITGCVLKSDILLNAARGQRGLKLAGIKREMVVVPEVLALPRFFARILDNLEHIALAVDEFGNFAGVVTLEDVVETLLGLEIVDEVDAVQDMQALARQQWAKRARAMGLPVDEVEASSREGAEAREPQGVGR